MWTDKPRVPLWVDADDPIVSQHLLQMGDWDAPLAQVLEKALVPDDVFLDLGAHVGYFSLVAANHCKHVIAVEPQEELCELLRRSKKPNVEVKQVAIGKEAGYKDLFIPPNRGAASFNHEIGYKERVEVVELSDVTDGATVAKIDIEGDEHLVTDEFLASLRFVVFEYQPPRTDGHFEQVQRAGFHIHSIYGELLEEPPPLPTGFYANLVGLRYAEEA